MEVVAGKIEKIIAGEISGGADDGGYESGWTPTSGCYRFRLQFESTDGRRKVGLGNYYSFAAAKAGIPYYRAWLLKTFSDDPFFTCSGQWQIVKEIYFDVN